MHAHAFANAIDQSERDQIVHPQRELVIAVPLTDRTVAGDARPRIHRFRSHGLELGRRLGAFRERYGLTLDEVAAAVSAGDGTVVGAWERGISVPDGVRRQFVIDLLEGRRWRELRTGLVRDADMPLRWRDGVRSYRRASRERPRRAT